MARPGRPERNRAARSFRQLRRFHNGINSNKVFGTHRWALQGAGLEGLWASCGMPGLELPDVGWPLALYFDELRPFERVESGQRHHDRLRDLDLARDATAFHAAGDIHGVAPNIEDEFGLADHPG